MPGKFNFGIIHCMLSTKIRELSNYSLRSEENIMHNLKTNSNAWKLPAEAADERAMPVQTKLVIICHASLHWPKDGIYCRRHRYLIFCKKLQSK